VDKPGAHPRQRAWLQPRPPITLDARSKVTRERAAVRLGAPDLQRTADVINALHVAGSSHSSGLDDDIEVFIDIDNLDLAHARLVGDAAHEIWVAQTEQRPAGRAAIQLINELMRHAPTLELLSGKFATSVTRRPSESPDSTLAQLIKPLLDVMAMGGASSLGVCANSGCGSVFIDTTPTHRRRWCEMATCGNRAKAARYRARQRNLAAADTPGRPPGKERSE